MEREIYRDSPFGGKKGIWLGSGGECFETFISDQGCRV